ncbi:MAG: hypothetical protein COB02_13940 [Candidatus Cloacimonadota bacterium]|nr:MAG: hypothetical protein COB02_13940 [Candidatus Cloacimonadota bacterium]
MPKQLLKTIFISNLVLPFAILSITPTVQLPSRLHASEAFFDTLNDEGDAFVEDEENQEIEENESGDEQSREADKTKYSGGSYDSSKKYSDFNKDELKKLQATKLSDEDYKAPKNLGIKGTKKWNEIIEKMSSLLGQVSKIQTLNKKASGELFGIGYKGISKQNIELGELEEASSIASFQLLKDFKELKKKMNEGNSSLELMDKFEIGLSETKKALGSHLQNISDMGSDEANKPDEEFKELMTSLFQEKDSTTALKLSEEGKYSELIGTRVTVFKGTPKVNLRIKTYSSIAVPKKGAKAKEFTQYRKSLASSKSLKPPYTKDHTQKRYMVRKVLTDTSGKVVALVVTVNKNSDNAYVIPVDTNKRYFKKAILVAKITNASAAKVSSFAAFQSLLKPVQNLTVSRESPITSFESEYTNFSIEEAKQLRDTAYKFYIDSLANQDLLLGQSFEALRSLYMSLDEIQNFLLSLGSQFEINNGKSGSSDGKANQLFYIGSSQNLLAAVVSIICQKYQFDSSGKVVDGQTIKNEYKINNVITTEYAVVKQSRLGNFYSVGTNNSDEIKAFDNIHRGQYSMNTFIYTGPGKAKIGLQYVGLNYSINHSNTYKVYILNPKHANYRDLLKELSKMSPDQSALGETVYFKLPLSETETFKTHPDIAIATREVKSKTTKADFVVDFNGKVQKGEPYVVYQEASGLRANSKNEWVDYDEVLTQIFAWNSRAYEPIDKDSFRIIIDGSGTMKKLFSPVKIALEKEFNKLGMGSFLKQGSKLKPLYYFGGEKAVKSPYNLNTLSGSVQAGGSSPINNAVKQLVCPETSGRCSTKNIPSKPWTLLVISDFDSRDKHFRKSSWATSVEKESSKGLTQTKVAVSGMMINDESGNYRVQSTSGNKGWRNLQAINLIGVGPFLGPIKTQNKTINLKAKPWLSDNASLKSGSYGVKFTEVQDGDQTALGQAIEDFLKPISDSIKMYNDQQPKKADW